MVIENISFFNSFLTSITLVLLIFVIIFFAYLIKKLICLINEATEVIAKVNDKIIELDASIKVVSKMTKYINIFEIIARKNTILLTKILVSNIKLVTNFLRNFKRINKKK